MSDPQTTVLLVGLAMALARAVEWLAKALMKRPQTETNGHSGQKPVSFWEQKMERIVEEGIGQAFRGRNEQVRAVFVEVNKPLYDKLDLMLENQSAVIEKLNAMLVELVRQGRA